MKIKTRTKNMQDKSANKILIYATYEIGWTWWNEQRYGARAYIRLVLNRLKVWGVLPLFIPLSRFSSKKLPSRLLYDQYPKNLLKV
jgi:hypothetical protein